MSLSFPYLSIRAPATTLFQWRPLIPIRLFDPMTGNSIQLNEALLDTGADDTVFPFSFARRLGISLLPFAGVSLQVRWRGLAFPLALADVELELTDHVQVFRWPARVGFSPAPISRPLLGRNGCMQYFDATFRGAAQLVILEANASYPSGGPHSLGAPGVVFS